MKRQVQETGVRSYFGEDLIELQAEPLAALDAFFAQYGPCIVQGCEVTENMDGTYDVTAGLVALEADDPAGTGRIMVMPFGGAAGVVFPLYMYAQIETVERLYDDGEVKPVAYDYTAQVSALPPAGGSPALTLIGTDVPRFVDVVQDASHRFISDAERTKWNGILQLAKEYAAEVAATGSEAALRSANEYTDTREASILAAADAKDATTLRTAKDYADMTINALVDGAPETMDTLREVAAELKKHEDTATAMMQVIGQKLNTADYTAEDVRAKLLEVDGRGSNLEADAIANQKTGAALKVWQGSEAEYNAIGTKDTDTLYIVL